jgi:hypothetical protein
MMRRLYGPGLAGHRTHFFSFSSFVLSAGKRHPSANVSATSECECLSADLQAGRPPVSPAAKGHWTVFKRTGINNPGESRVFKFGGYFGTSRLFFEPLTDWPSLAVSL